VTRVRALVLAGLYAVAARALAHDMITAEEAERYLAQVDQAVAIIKSREPALRRAQADVTLGRMLDDIRDLLNRDLAAHGKVQGLPSNYLVAELRRRGAPLNFARERFMANVGYYRDALKLAPDGPHAAEAMLRWMRGAFYDSFDGDPLEGQGQTPEQLSEQLALGERFVQRYPTHPEIEEAKFILLVQTIRAANAAADAASRAALSARARAAGQELATRYPDSMRAAAVPVLIERLPATSTR